MCNKKAKPGNRLNVIYKGIGDIGLSDSLGFLSKKERKIYKMGLMDDYALSEADWWRIHHKVLKHRGIKWEK